MLNFQEHSSSFLEVRRMNKYVHKLAEKFTTTVYTFILVQVFNLYDLIFLCMRIKYYLKRNPC